MIILGNEKDFYDYVVNQYGRDDKKVFDRRNVVSSLYYFETTHKNKENWADLYFEKTTNRYFIHIGNRKYCVQQIEKGVWCQAVFHKKNKHFNGNPFIKVKSQVKNLENYVDYLESNVYTKTRQPISLESLYHDEMLEGVPLLKNFGVTAFIDAHDVYTEIDMCLGWLNDNPVMNMSFDDAYKLQSHGFDKKKSFRHRK